MVLISCPRCGKSVSERAVKCPHCGFMNPSVQAIGLYEIVQEINYDFVALVAR